MWLCMCAAITLNRYNAKSHDMRDSAPIEKANNRQNDNCNEGSSAGAETRASTFGEQVHNKAFHKLLWLKGDFSGIA